MPVRLAKAADVSAGTYLTDGVGLFRVLPESMPEGEILLEDCKHPWAPALLVKVTELVKQGMRVVNPAP